MDNELHLGKMTSQELAKWFGISYGSYRSRKIKEQKLEELKYFADFEEIYGGVNILDIKIPVYSKKAQLKQELLQKVFLEEWENESHNDINTCSNVARKIQQKYGDELNLETSSITTYSRNIRKQDFGIPFFTDGKKGSCAYLWSKIILVDEKEGIYICEELTEEETKIKNELLLKYFSVKDASAIEKKIIIDEMVQTGEITKDIAYDLYKDVDQLNSIKFQEYLSELKRRIGAPVMKTTQLFIGKYVHAGEQLQLKEGNFNFE